MPELLSLSIGLGIAVSLLLTELFAIPTGGMIVPGYLALHFNTPLSVLVTMLAGFATYGLVQALSSLTIIYGRRRTVLMILIGYLVGSFFRWSLPQTLSSDIPANVIGYIVPGLIGIWLDRQGPLEATCSLVIASSLVRLLLIAIMGNEMLT